jgi:hypothetical protein
MPPNVDLDQCLRFGCKKIIYMDGQQICTVVADLFRVAMYCPDVDIMETVAIVKKGMFDCPFKLERLMEKQK